MSSGWNLREYLRISFSFIKWILIAFPVSAVVGSAVAFFLWSLDRVTHARWDYPWLLWLLPVAGVLIGWLYKRLGESLDAGHDLIVREINEPKEGVPFRLAPLVLFATLLTHLCGGSAGREGTAVQMGGGIVSTLGKWMRLPKRDVQTLLMVAVAAGFGAVFGTPVAGAVFAIEVLASGRITLAVMLPCLLASIVGDWSSTAWGIGHTQFYVKAFADKTMTAGMFGIQWPLMGKVVLASVGFGLAAALFIRMKQGLSQLFKRLVPWELARPAVGGLIIIGLVYALGTREYLGLGVAANPNTGGVSIVSSFDPGGATPWSWWWKILFTTITLSCGFKGGEVTPLFFVGATLGNTLAWLLAAPTDLFAALGFVAVLAGATNTPLTCTILGIELFGRTSGLVAAGFVPYVAVACFTSYLFSGTSGIYASQRTDMPKLVQ